MKLWQKMRFLLLLRSSLFLRVKCVSIRDGGLYNCIESELPEISTQQ
ncbi:hypothetical protein [Helicobacter typhlonius]